MSTTFIAESYSTAERLPDSSGKPAAKLPGGERGLEANSRDKSIIDAFLLTAPNIYSFFYEDHQQ